MRTRRRQQAGAFMLLELMVVSVLMLVVAMMTGLMWRHFEAQAANLSHRTHAAQELKFALESLSRDLGALVWAHPLSPARLAICRKTGDGEPDVIVDYSLEEGQLVRTDPGTGAALVVASHVEEFLVEDVTESLLRVVITVAYGNTARQATLLWSRS